MNPALIVVVMFLAVVVLFVLRTPVAFTLGAVGIAFLLMINGPRFLILLPPSEQFQWRCPFGLGNTCFIE